MKYQVTATLEQLKSVGLGEEEFNAIGEFIKDYKDGWFKMKFKKDYYLDGVTYLDVPKSMLKEI